MIAIDEQVELPDVPTRTLLGSFSVARRDGLHALVRAARAGDPTAVAAVLEGVRRGARAVWPEVSSGIVVAVPGHLPGPPNELVVAAAETLSVARGWHPDGTALRRHGVAPEAKLGGPRDAGAEGATLEWLPPRRGRVIVLVDDVVRTGATVRACALAIRMTGDLRPVVAIALATAIAPDLPRRPEAGQVRLGAAWAGSPSRPGAARAR